MLRRFRGAGPVHIVVRLALYTLLAGAFAVCGAFGWSTYRAVKANPDFQQRILAGYGVDQSAKHLDPRFNDANGDMLADPPSDPTKLVDPEPLEFAYVKSDTGTDPFDWNAVGKTIGDATGKIVNVHGFSALGPEVDNITAGKIQVLAVHAAETPYLVNHYGFIPFAIAADDHGPSGHRLTLIAKPTSPIQTAEEIRTHNLVCTQALSIVGYRAAIAYLMQNYSLRPD